MNKFKKYTKKVLLASLPTAFAPLEVDIEQGGVAKYLAALEFL